MTSPPADVINLGHYDDNGEEQDGFRQLTPEELQLLAAKMHSSPNVKVLNLSGYDMSASRFKDVAEALVKLAKLECVNLTSCWIGDEVAGRLAEPLGKLTALQALDLSCTGLSCFCLWGRRVMLRGTGRCIAVVVVSQSPCR